MLAAAAALVVAGGVSTAGTLSASAATPGCSRNGNTCVQIFSKRFGTQASPGFVESSSASPVFASGTQAASSTARRSALAQMPWAAADRHVQKPDSGHTGTFSITVRCIGPAATS